MKKTFVNEKGNKIIISVNKNYTPKTVKISMIGPKTKTTNVITKKEAKILKGLL